MYWVDDWPEPENPTPSSSEPEIQRSLADALLFFQWPDHAVRHYRTYLEAPPTDTGNSRISDIEVTPALAFEIAALARMRDGVSGPEARALFPPEVLNTSAIPPLARVLSVNGRTVTSRAQIQREFRGTRRPVLVLLRQGGSQFFIAVEPPR